MANYLDSLTAAQRAELLAPSHHLIAFQAFVATYRKEHPTASMNAIQHAYQMSGGKSSPPVTDRTPRLTSYARPRARL